MFTPYAGKWIYSKFGQESALSKSYNLQVNKLDLELVCLITNY